MSSKEHSDNEKAGSTASLKQKFKSENPDAGLLEHPSYIEMQEKLTQTEKEKTENWERCLRMQAEMDNMQRRVERDISNAHKYALEKFVMELLPVVDSLERAVGSHASEDATTGSLLDGVNMTLKMFTTALEKFGVQQVDPQSQPFNPELHQAVSTLEDPSVKPNTVMNVLQKGYLLNNRLIRPALVVVAKG